MFLQRIVHPQKGLFHRRKKQRRLALCDLLEQFSGRDLVHYYRVSAFPCSCRLAKGGIVYFAMILPGMAILSVPFRPTVGWKILVGFEVSVGSDWCRTTGVLFRFWGFELVLSFWKKNRKHKIIHLNQKAWLEDLLFVHWKLLFLFRNIKSSRYFWTEKLTNHGAQTPPLNRRRYQGVLAVT
jgi:hypothetical protein